MERDPSNQAMTSPTPPEPAGSSGASGDLPADGFPAGSASLAERNRDRGTGSGGTAVHQPAVHQPASPQPASPQPAPQPAPAQVAPPQPAPVHVAPSPAVLTQPAPPPAGPSARRSPAVPPLLDKLAALSWRVLLILAAAAVLTYALIRLRLVVLPIIVALFVSTMLVPPARRLRNRGWRPGLATGVVFIGAALVFALLVLVLVPPVANQLGQLGRDVSAGLDEVQSYLAEGPLNISETQLDGYLDQAREQLRGRGSAIATGVLSGAVLLVEVVAGFLLAIVILFFFVRDGDVISGWFANLWPPHRREDVRAAGRRAYFTLGAYLKGVAITGLVDGALIGIGLAVIGVPLVLPLAVLTFLGAFIPLIGATIAGLLAALVALVSEGPRDALLVVALVAGIQQVEGDVLAPLVQGRALKLHPLAVALALAAGAAVSGALGAILGVPAVAVAAGVIDELRTRNATTTDTGPTDAAPPGP